MEFVCCCATDGEICQPASMEMCKSKDENKECFPVAFVLQINRDEIGLVDLKRGSIVDSDDRVPFSTFAQTGRSPSDIVASEDGRQIFVSHWGDNFIAVYDTTDFFEYVIPKYRKISIPGSCSSLATSYSSGKLYAALPYERAVAVIDMGNISEPADIIKLSDIHDVEEPAGEIASDEVFVDDDWRMDSDEDENEDVGDLWIDSENELVDVYESNPGDEVDGDWGGRKFSFMPWYVKVPQLQSHNIVAVSGSGEDGGLLIFDAEAFSSGMRGALISHLLPGVSLKNFDFTPDGSFLYAVDGENGSVHVVNMMTGVEVDTNGGNPLSQSGEMKLPGQVLDLTIKELDFGESTDKKKLKGVFGFLVTTQGYLYVVDIRDDNCKENCRSHVLRNANEDSESLPVWMNQPIVLIDNKQIQYVDFEALHTDAGYPTPDPSKLTYYPQGPTGSVYYMYGVSFFPYDPWEESTSGGNLPDIRRAITQQWRISYEDTIPNSKGIGGNIEPGGVMVDSGLPFCLVGVRDGDILVIDSSPSPIDSSVDCSIYKSDGGMEYKITEAYQFELHFEPVLNGDGVIYSLPTEECFPFAVKYHVRVSGQWLVTGSSTGYLNDWTTDSDGRCLDAKPPCSSWNEEGCTLLAGRAVESRPFVNPYIKFVIVPGTDPVPSHLTFLYNAVSGFTPLSMLVARLPGSIRYLPWNRSLYITDEATEGLVEVNLENFVKTTQYY